MEKESPAAGPGFQCPHLAPSLRQIGMDHAQLRSPASLAAAAGTNISTMVERRAATKPRRNWWTSLAKVGASVPSSKDSQPGPRWDASCRDLIHLGVGHGLRLFESLLAT